MRATTLAALPESVKQGWPGKEAGVDPKTSYVTSRCDFITTPHHLQAFSGLRCLDGRAWIAIGGERQCVRNYTIAVVVVAPAEMLEGCEMGEISFGPVILAGPNYGRPNGVPQGAHRWDLVTSHFVLLT